MTITSFTPKCAGADVDLPDVRFEKLPALALFVEHPAIARASTGVVMQILALPTSTGR